MTFLLSPIGRILGATVMAGLLLTMIYWRGYEAAQKRCETAALTSELAVARQDLKIAQDTAKNAEKAAQDLESYRIRDQKKLNRLEKSRGSSSCPLSRTDARQLQSIR